MHKRFSRYAWGVLILNLAVILWGALVRASQSGDGCGDHWPLCNGTVIPHAATIATLIEFTHRVTTGLALISVVVMAIWANRVFRKQPVATAATASLFLILTEALLGAGLVLMKYVGQDASTGRAVYLSAHLVNTLLMLGAMALTAWWGSGHRSIEWSGRPGTLLAVGIAAFLILGVSGGITALGDTLYPSTSLRAGFEADFSAASPFFLRVRIWHAGLACLTAGYLIAITLSISRALPGARQIGLALISLAALQISAGVLNMWLLAPVWMQLVHLLLADLVWIALVLFSAAAMEKGAVRDITTPKLTAV